MKLGISLISYSLHRLRCPSARKYRQLQKKLPILLNFFSLVTIFLIQTSIIKTFKNMTTISTSSENLFSKIQKYLKNKRVGFTSSLSNEAFAWRRGHAAWITTILPRISTSTKSARLALPPTSMRWCAAACSATVT